MEEIPARNIHPWSLHILRVSGVSGPVTARISHHLFGDWAACLHVVIRNYTDPETHY